MSRASRSRSREGSGRHPALTSGDFPRTIDWRQPRAAVPRRALDRGRVEDLASTRSTRRAAGTPMRRRADPGAAPAGALVDPQRAAAVRAAALQPAVRLVRGLGHRRLGVGSLDLLPESRLAAGIGTAQAQIGAPAKTRTVYTGCRSAVAWPGWRPASPPSIPSPDRATTTRQRRSGEHRGGRIRNDMNMGGN